MCVYNKIKTTISAWFFGCQDVTSLSEGFKRLMSTYDADIVRLEIQGLFDKKCVLNDIQKAFDLNIETNINSKYSLLFEIHNLISF